MDSISIRIELRRAGLFFDRGPWYAVLVTNEAAVTIPGTEAYGEQEALELLAEAIGKMKPSDR